MRVISEEVLGTPVLCDVSNLSGAAAQKKEVEEGGE